MDIDICIDYVADDQSHGSAVYINESSLCISNFAVYRSSGEIVIDYPRTAEANELALKIERAAIPLIRAEYERMSGKVLPCTAKSV